MVKAEVHSPLKSKLAHKFGSLTFSLTRLSILPLYFTLAIWLRILSKLSKLTVGVTFNAWFTEVLCFPFCTVYIENNNNNKVLGLRYDLCLSSKLADDIYVFYLSGFFLCIFCNFWWLLFWRMAAVSTLYIAAFCWRRSFYLFHECKFSCFLQRSDTFTYYHHGGLAEFWILFSWLSWVRH